MLSYSSHNWSYLMLRLGLGLVFAWIGANIFLHPTEWIGYVPNGLPIPFSREVLLMITGAMDALLGLAFFLNVWPKWVAGFAALHLLGILVFNRIDAVTIRDIGLLGASLALFFWPHQSTRRRW